MDPTFTADWFSKNTPNWKRWLGQYTGLPDLKFLEVGSYEGMSACWLLQNILTHETAHLTCIDVFELCPEQEEIQKNFKLTTPLQRNLEATFDHNIRAVGAESKVTKLKGLSGELLRTIPVGSLDAAYIDGSHTARNVLTDAVLTFDLLKEHGILIFDDYQWNCFPDDPVRNPAAGIDAFLRCFDGEYDILDKGEQVALRRKKSIREKERNFLPLDT